MEGRLRNMTSVYITNAGKMLLLFRQGGRVVNNVWTGSAGGHFEEWELNDARACVLREMEEELGKIRQHLKTDFAGVNWEEGLREMQSRLMMLLQEAERQLDMIDGERQKE